MSNEMIAILGKMLRECKAIRQRERISTGTAADILHGFASEIFAQLKKEEGDGGKSPSDEREIRTVKQTGKRVMLRCPDRESGMCCNGFCNGLLAKPSPSRVTESGDHLYTGYCPLKARGRFT